tara:strand:- start:69752 stop:70030 length:279 start_codon:yes stop_codon:yes gene_type:complete
MPRLVRDRDGEGHYGSRVESYNIVEDDDGIPVEAELVGHEPMVGCKLLVGTITAGMFSERDFWITTPITEIISETEKEIKFLTGNSRYTFYK